MITPWTIYWITRLDVLHTIIAQMLILGVLNGVIGLMIWLVARMNLSEPEHVDAIGKRGLMWWLPVMLTMGTIYIATPTTKEMAAIIVIPEIANNQDIQALGSDLPKLAREWIENLGQKSKQ